MCIQMDLEKNDFWKNFEVKFSWKFSFLKIYVMGSTQVDFLDIVHVKVGFFAVLKMCVRARLGKFVWSTLFVQCVCVFYERWSKNLQKTDFK